MREVRDVRRLGVDDGVEVRARPLDRVVVDREVRVPFGRQPLEEARRRRVQRGPSPSGAMTHGAEVGHRVGRDVAEAAAGARDDDDVPAEVRRREREARWAPVGEAAADLDGPADADRDVARGTLARIDGGDAPATLADGDEDVVEAGVGLADRHRITPAC